MWGKSKLPPLIISDFYTHASIILRTFSNLDADITEEKEAILLALHLNEWPCRVSLQLCVYYQQYMSV